MVRLLSQSCRCSWVKINGTVYKPDNIVAVYNNLMPVFGRIIDIIVVSITDCYFVCEIFTTVTFNTHYHAYEVQEQRRPTRLVVCKQSELIDYHVLGMYHLSNTIFVPLKYYLPESI